MVVEVKGKDKKADYEANKCSYNGKPSSLHNETFSKEIGFNAFQKLNQQFEYKIIFDAHLQEQQRELMKKIKALA